MIGAIDVLWSAPQYATHLVPLWVALPDEIRGDRVWQRRRINDAVLVASSRDLVTARQIGYSRIAYLEHGIGQSYSNGHSGYPGGRGRDAVGLFLSPNETAAGKDRAAYPASRVEIIGDPRLDTLPALVAEPGTVAIGWHWECRVAPESRSAFPHYRSAIAGLAAAVPLIGHAHPKARAAVEPFYRRRGIEFVADFDDVCRRASVFVADNTSCLYEFASTGRPVVVLNAPWYRRDVSHGLRFWDAADIGRQVDEPGDLVAGIEKALADAPEQRIAREAALAIAYGFRTGAAERGAAILADWLAA